MKTRSISRLASCCIIAGCLGQTLMAQSSDFFRQGETQVLSPSAYEMGKYGKVPVSYFNGLPNISVPLTEVRAKGYTLPVYLTYYAGGNRPDQHPGWVGQGWTLHAGGSITRIIKGSKDDMSKEEYPVTSGSTLTPSSDPGYLYHASESQTSISWNNALTLRNTALGVYSPMEYYHMDYEPDEFILDIEGIHASFYITGKDEVKIVSRSDASFDIEWTIGTDHGDFDALPVYQTGPNKTYYARRYSFLKSFTVHDREGNVYYFGGNDEAIEYSIVQYPQIEYNGSSYYATDRWRAVGTANTWMLTRIERADGEVITFTYKKDGIPVAVHDFNHGESFAGTSNGNTDYGNNDTAETAVTVKNNLNVSFLLPSYLESISCRVSGDSLEFSSSPSTELRYDLSEDDFLLRVGNFSGTNSPLTYSIYQSLDYYMKLDTISGVDRNVAFSYSNNANTRLKLNSILFLTAKNGVIDHKYEFKYNSTPLPAYNSRKTDRWGYYNGVSYTVGNFGHSLYSDRVPDAALMQAEILEEIVYPTGGRTKFKYEPHTYYRVAKQFPFNLITCQTDSIAGGLRIKSITDEPFRGTAETRLFTYTQSNSPTAHSSGILSGRQVFFSSSSLTDSYYGMNSSYSFAMYSEQPLNLLSDTDGNHVTYSRVVETKGDGGYTVYTYSNHDSSFGADENPIVTLYGGPTSLSLVSNFSSGELFRGLLLSCNVYDSLDNITHSEAYQYETNRTDFIKSVSKEVYFGIVYSASYCAIYCTYPKLSEKTIINYQDSGSAISENYNYEYNSFRRPTSTTHAVGSATDGTVTYYPEDRSGITYTRMEEAGMAGVPVGTATLRQGNVIAAKEMTFRPESVETEDGTATAWLPDKLYSAELSSPVSLSNYNSSPASYLSAVPDMEYRNYDSHGNVTGTIDADGISTIYQWGKDALNPVLVAKGARTSSSSYTDSQRIVNYEIDFGGIMMETYYFSTTTSHTVSASIYGSSYYDWLYLVQVDNQSAYIVSSQIPGDIPDDWMQYLMSYGSLAEFTVPAGDHTLTIREITFRTGSGTPTHPYGTIQLRYYDAATTNSGASDVAVIYDFEDETGSTPGFNSAHGHSGTKTVNLSIPSDREYILDYMLKNGSTWTYNSSAYTGGSVTVGASGKVIDNIRIYPAYSDATSYTWAPGGKMLSVTDIRGVTESYEYDGLGRLTNIKNNEGNNIKSYAYHYADTTYQNNAKINHNSITETTYTAAGGSTYRNAVQYLDGLGRSIAEILENGGGSGEDILTAQNYDEAGRLWKKWLPTPLSGTVTGTFYDSAQSSGQSYYSDTYPYTESIYETSPRERIVSEYGPGADWRTASKDIEYGLMSNSSVSSNMLYHRGFSVSWSSTGALTLTRKAASSAATLKVIKTTDEDDRSVLEFYNSYGEKVLERRLMTTSSTGWYDTHFVYDNMGRLAVVIPPKLTNQLGNSTTSWTESSISALAFIYRYDSRGNCIAKSLPGGGWTYIVFDKYNRPVMTQDAVQRSSNQWTFSFVDRIGRPAVSGTATISLDAFGDPYKTYDVHAEMPKSPTYSGTYKGYNVTGITLSSPTLLSVYFYDWMKFLTVGGAGFPAANSSDVTSDNPGTGYASVHSNSRGLLTGNLTKVLDNAAGNQYLWSVYYYDEYGRVAQSRAYTHTGGVTKEWMGYDFTGNLTLSKTTYIPTIGSSVTHMTTYTYDAMGRPAGTSLKIGSNLQESLTYLLYDEVGRLASTTRDGKLIGTTLGNKLGSSYGYNLRSWLKEISGGLFSESLQYQDAQSSTYRQWGGNISGMDWESGTENRLRHYDFTYDKLARLTAATYVENAVSGAFNATYTYDRNTNLSSVQHKGLNSAGTASTTVLNQSISISGNQISSVATYDAKGRQTSYTQGTSRTMTYNLLDLPQQETVGSTIVIDRKYGADGTKLQEKVTTSGSSVLTRDYIGNLIYENGTLKKILFDGGYVDMTGSAPAYRFYLTDHLGNVRVVTASDGTVMQVNHYYPYGGLMIDPRHTISSTNASDSRYRFTGKELSEESGEYDFGARFLDPIPGRFTTIDPLAEKYYSLSPYGYCAGNPIRLVDPNGMDIYLYDKKTGQLDLYKTTGDEFDQIGELKRNRKKGDIRIMINNIEKGILDPDGMNFHSDTRIDLTGINGPSLAAVEDFLLDFSNMIDTEVGGYYVSEAGQTDVRYVTIGNVSKNTSNNAVPGSPYNALFDLPGFSVEKYDILVNYHTHLSRFSDSDRLRPSSLGISGGDIGFKDRQQSRYPSMQYLIITNPEPFYY